MFYAAKNKGDRMIRPLVAVLIMVASCEAARAFTVDADIPAGNIIVNSVEGDVVKIRQDFRDTPGHWFYWAFRVRGAAGRTLTFDFGDSPAVGSRGAAVSEDRGEHWRWSDFERDDPRDPATGDHASYTTFTWKFGPDDNEVWFSQTFPYAQSDWETFLAAHSADYGRVFVTNTLCLSKKGRPVEAGRFGRIDGKAKYRMLVTSRHHCAEVTATFVMEGLLASVFGDDELGKWMRENIEIRAVPFVDKDGVVDGDQGKNRRPYDHCRDYNDDRPSIHPEIKAIREMLEKWAKESGAPSVVMDLHCPWLRGSWFKKDDSNEYIYAVGIKQVEAKQRRMCEILERVQESGSGFLASDYYAEGRGWNSGANYTAGSTLTQWAIRTWPDAPLVICFEIPFANARRMTLTPPAFRLFGRDIALALKAYLEP